MIVENLVADSSMSVAAGGPGGENSERGERASPSFRIQSPWRSSDASAASESTDQSSVSRPGSLTNSKSTPTMCCCCFAIEKELFVRS